MPEWDEPNNYGGLDERCTAIGFDDVSGWVDVQCGCEQMCACDNSTLGDIPSSSSYTEGHTCEWSSCWNELWSGELIMWLSYCVVTILSIVTVFVNNKYHHTAHAHGEYHAVGYVPSPFHPSQSSFRVESGFTSNRSEEPNDDAAEVVRRCRVVIQLAASICVINFLAQFTEFLGNHGILGRSCLSPRSDHPLPTI